MTNVPIWTTAEGLPKFEGVSLAALSIADLRNLHQAVVTLQSVSCAIESQQCFWETAFDHTPAGAIMSEVIALFDGFENAIMDAVEARTPSDENEVGNQALVRLFAETRMSHDRAGFRRIADLANTGNDKLAVMEAAQ